MTEFDLKELQQVSQDIFEKYQTVLKKCFSFKSSNPIFGLVDLTRLWLSFQKVMWQTSFDLLDQSTLTNQLLNTLLSDFEHLNKAIIEQLDSGTIANLVTTDSMDRRFKSKLWQQPVFNYVKQCYLILCKNITAFYSDAKFNDEFAAGQARFYIKLLLETLSPSNFILTNPEILQLTANQLGINLLKGLRNYLEDLDLWHGFINFKKADQQAFTLGENIAYTQGKVMMQNKLMQLIQYHATTDQVHATPILLTTSFINKYYILDLRENNSLIHWLVNQGYTVFVISWVNPDSQLRDQDFPDYIVHGVVAATEKILQLTGQPQCHAFGFCLGGTLIGSAAAYLAAKKCDYFKSISLIATMLDFTNAGLMNYYSGPEQVQMFNHSMQKDGYWSGQKMLTAINTLESNLYIWPYYINQYLRGNSPTSLDLLYWTNDMTNTPQQLYHFYLSDLIRHNILTNPGRLKIQGIDLDLTKIKCPTFIVAFQNDAISPWHACYDSTKLLTSKQTFILFAANHIMGMLSSPQRCKYTYWENQTLPNNANDWLASAKEYKGSWWPKWENWLNDLSDQKITARKINEDSIIEDAPGSFAKVRLK